MKRFCLTALGYDRRRRAAVYRGCVRADSGGRAAASQQARVPGHTQKFWDFLQNAQYKRWPGQDGDLYQGTDPHEALLKIYINRQCASNPQNPPDESIITKENYAPNKKLAAITIMQREGYGPEYGNWWRVKYNPDGTVAEQNGMRLAGKVKGCIQCHSQAKGNELIYTNGGEAERSRTES